VRWSLRRNERADDSLCIDRGESGGPTVTPPTRSGFGASVVHELIPYELGGAVDLMYLPEGVCCRMQIPAHWLSPGKRQGDSLGDGPHRELDRERSLLDR
jgi:two-component sensor histidine kinase